MEFNNINQLPLGTVLMDNFTVSSAIDLLTPERKEYEHGPNIFPLQRDKPVALISLSNLIENIIIHDKIYVDEAYISYWIERNSKQVDLLKKLISPIRLSDSDRMLLIKRAAERIRLILPSIGSFINELTIKGFLGYFQSSMFHYYPQKSTTYQGQLIAEELNLILNQNSLQIFSADLTDLLKNIKNTLGWGEDYFYENPTIPDAVCFLPSSHAAELILLGLGAFIYDELSRTLGRPYSPHVLRAPFLLFDHASKYTNHSTTSKQAIKYLEYIYEESSASATKFLSEGIFSIKLPLIFTSLLKKITKADELLHLALEMRNASEAIAFREWMKELDEIIVNGNLPQVKEKISNLKKQLDGLQHLFGNDAGNIAVQIGISPLIIELPIPLPEVLSKKVKKYKINKRLHLKFCYSLYETSMSQPAVQKRLEEVFGIDSDLTIAAYNLKDYLLQKQSPMSSLFKNNI